MSKIIIGFPLYSARVRTRTPSNVGGKKDRLELLSRAHQMPGLFTRVVICNPPNIAIRYVALFSFYRLGN